MINLNEIAFIDTDGFDYNDGECLIRFDTVAYYPDKKQITFAVTKQGRISVLDYQVFEDTTLTHQSFKRLHNIKCRRPVLCDGGV